MQHALSNATTKPQPQPTTTTTTTTTTMRMTTIDPFVDENAYDKMWLESTAPSLKKLAQVQRGHLFISSKSRITITSHLFSHICANLSQLAASEEEIEKPVSGHKTPSHMQLGGEMHVKVHPNSNSLQGTTRPSLITACYNRNATP